MHVQYPDGNVLLRNLSRKYPIIDRGDGVWLIDRDGKRYLDGSSGALVASVGHGRRDLASRVGDQLARVGYVNGQQFTSEVTEELASKLARLAAPLGSREGGLTKSAFLGSGSEAVEAAVKWARQIHFERGHVKRAKVIARSPGYHGNTLYALSASARPHYKKFFGPLLSDVVMVSAPYGYRSPVAVYDRDGAEHYARELEATIAREGAETISAFIFEPVIGSSAGASTPPSNYYQRIQEICRKHGILMIADEILCGVGRTGKFFASEHYGIEPDVVTLGKGINGGYGALSVVMVRAAHLEEIKRGTGYFMHAQTYLQAPCMTVAGLGVLEVMENEGLVARSEKMGRVLHQELRQALGAHPHVGSIAGVGLLAGVEFVEDRATKRAFTRAQKKVEALVDAAFSRGLILWPNVGHANEVDGDLVMVGPPLTISDTEIRELVERLSASIEVVFGPSGARG